MQQIIGVNALVKRLNQNSFSKFFSSPLRAAHTIRNRLRLSTTASRLLNSNILWHVPYRFYKRSWLPGRL